MFIFTMTALNIAAVTILGWCLFDSLVGGTFLTALEILLFLSTCLTLWWSSRIFEDNSEQKCEETDEIYDEDDFIVH